MADDKNWLYVINIAKGYSCVGITSGTVGERGLYVDSWACTADRQTGTHTTKSDHRSQTSSENSAATCIESQFTAFLLMVKNAGYRSTIQKRITIEIQPLSSWTMPNPSARFRRNSFILVTRAMLSHGRVTNYIAYKRTNPKTQSPRRLVRVNYFLLDWSTTCRCCRNSYV